MGVINRIAQQGRIFSGARHYIHMRSFIIIALGVGLLSFTYSEITRYVFRQDGLHVEYGKEHGLLTSKYVSYWPNGKKKAEGEMRGNMRYGEWHVYDTSGALATARAYETGYAWTQLYPIEFDQTSSRGWFGDRFSLIVEIKPDSVIHSVRLWRFIPYVQNSPIFAKNALLDTIIAMTHRDEIVVGEDDELIRRSTFSDVNDRLERCNPQHQVVGYKLKEDWYYDAKKRMGIYGIIAICPVLMAKNSRDSIDLGWLAYDKVLRNKMATMFYVPPVMSGYPAGVEQTFFLRCFESEVYQYSNVGFKTIAQLYPDPAERKTEIQRMEIQQLEWEHDFWVREYAH